ncbi:MAG: ATPase domain-containing protein [Candidatus Bathyarchaeia archaeon]
MSGTSRVPTGISGLDAVIGGGFPRGGLIVLAGNPGTGKTMFSASFLYNGIANYGERGIYASFAESKETFLSNMLELGFDFKRLEAEERFSFLDLMTAKEGAVSTTLEMIISEVSRIEAKRLVIDSFSALAQAFRETYEARIILHTILSRITKILGCTTILIVEVPYGEERVGLGIEEFVADGIILLKRSRLDGRILRDLEILKMRGMPTPETQLVLTLKGGFKAFPPFKVKVIEKPCRFEPRPDTKKFFSTGSQDLDEMLGGGYPRGSLVLIEIGEQIATLQYHLISAITAYNFTTQGRGVILIPSSGVDHNLIRKKAEEGGLTEDEINRLLRVYIRKYPGFKPEPFVVTLEGESITEYVMSCFNAEYELMKETGQPVLRIVGADTLIDTYGVKEALSALRACAMRARETESLCIILLKPGYPRVAKILSAMADVHLRITREHGSVLVYGVKPRTNLHVLEMDASKGYPIPKLTPII